MKLMADPANVKESCIRKMRVGRYGIIQQGCVGWESVQGR